MDNLDESEKNAKVSDSAYSNSCSNSQSRRSHSSKSTHSGSNSSGSSGYGGKQSTSGSSQTISQVPEKRTKDKEGKKRNQQAQTEIVQIQTDVEFRLPDLAPITETEEELEIASSPPVSDQTQNGVQGSLEVVKEDTVENRDTCIIPGPSTNVCTTKSGYSEEFSCLISMHDGVVLYISTSLTDMLGFPKDMWVGRSFIDFVHPLDYNTFASQITSGLAVPKDVNGMLDTVQSPGNSVSTIFCRIRRYRSLPTGFDVKGRLVSFIPFMLKLSFKNVCEEKGSTIYLVIQAKPVVSAFNTPNEVNENPIPFVMRHAANGNLEYIDNEAVRLLGYLPQDITGINMMELYYPEDLPYARHLYQTIINQGQVPRSRPYRLMAQNGDYLKLETEWSSFINPWSRKLEFVTGKHYVVEGPANPDVFQPPPTPKATKVPEEDDIEIEDLRDSIVKILNEVPTRPSELVKQEMAKQCTDLASFMESIIKEQPRVEEELRLEIQENDSSHYERDSVMLGGISPHHDHSDSKSSTGTCLSYNQLNYNINIKRYFDSHQEAFGDQSANVTDTTTMVQIKGHVYTGGCMWPTTQYSGDSMDITAAESSCVTYEEGRMLALPHDYQSIRLTESILTKHNSDMEKILLKNHRKVRPAKKEERVKLSNESKQKKKDHLVRCNASFVPTTSLNTAATEPQPHGLKRASKQAEVEPSTHKHHCASSRQMRRRQPPGAAAPQPSVSTAPIWPCSLVNGITPYMPQQMSLINPFTAMPGFVPMYYSPTAGPAIPCAPATSAHDSPPQFQAPPVQYMMYGQAVFGPPILVSPMNHQQNFPRPPGVIQSQFACVQNNLSLATRNYEEACKPGLSLKPPSKSQLAAGRGEKRGAAATAMPGCTRHGAGRSSSNSICSATNALNRSNEEVTESSESRYSKMKSEETIDRTDGESSYDSSFYSSFFRTDSGSAEESGDAKSKPYSVNFGVPAIPGKDNLLNKNLQRRRKEPPWMQQVCVTSELIYKYQVLTKSLDEVLISDREKLVKVEQPSLVNDQLGQLYTELQLEGVAARLTLEEGITSSGSSSDDGHKFATAALAKRARKKRKNSKLVMIFEEDAPLPCPDDDSEPGPSTSVA